MDQSVAAPQTNLASSSIRQVFLQWEWLRIWYNTVLVFWVLGLVSYFVAYEPNGHPDYPWGWFWLSIVEGAVVSNICFFLGPASEAYLHWLGVWAHWMRALVFVAGLAFTAFAAFVVVAFLLAPH
jgi:hypothetical protein